MHATWILPDGSHKTAEVPDGMSLMQAAVAHNIPFVMGECGGNLSCATCQVYVHDDRVAVAGRPGAFEDPMLDLAEAQRRPTSRLSCQIKASAALDGLVLIVPEPGDGPSSALAGVFGQTSEDARQGG